MEAIKKPIKKATKKATMSATITDFNDPFPSAYELGVAAERFVDSWASSKA
ncbi:hypothetical protein VB005_09135 [Metarhizium brunneum]